MALIYQHKTMTKDVTSTSTFHEAIKQFMQPSNPSAKPALPILKKRGKKRDPRLAKPDFELSKESAWPLEKDPLSRQSDGSSATVLRFKSPAVYCEVKLTEMLSKAKEPREKFDMPGKYSELPDAFRTSVCCQVMAEVSKLATPFTKVLCIIQNELENSIYSNYVTPSTTTIFEQVPYFELVNSLEKKNRDMVVEQEKWDVLQDQRQVEVDGLEKHIQELKEQITSERETMADLEKNLTSTVRALEKSNKEVVRLTDQISKSRSEVIHARDTESRLVETDANYEILMAKHLIIVHELQRSQSNLEVARREAADGIPKKEMVVARAQIKELQHKLIKADILTEQMGTMTPRPHWALLRGGSHYVMSTAAQAAEICKLNDLLLENVTSLRLECATAQVALAELKQQRRGDKSTSPTSMQLTEEQRPKST